MLSAANTAKKIPVVTISRSGNCMTSS